MSCLDDLLIDFRLIFARFGGRNRPTIDDKSIQRATETKMQVGMDFGWLLDRFLVDLGAKLGAKLGPSWHQNSKIMRYQIDVNI